MEQLSVIYRDDYLVAVNKPSGLLVHRSPIDRHETRFALQLVRDQIGQRVYPVHRLDKPTSGVLLFALSPDTARNVSEQIASHWVAKTYHAVVRGYCPEAGEVDHVIRDKPDKFADSDRTRERPALEAITRYRCLATAEIPFAVDRYPRSRYSLVELKPLHGRKHQLRRHMKHLGHPIIGDANYGKGVHNRFFQKHYQCHRLLLACTGMGLLHPVNGQRLLLTAPVGDDFYRVLDALGWTNVIDSSLRHAVNERLVPAKQ